MANMRRTAFLANERWKINQIKKGNKLQLQETIVHGNNEIENITIETEHPAKITKIRYKTEEKEKQEEGKYIKIYTDGSKTEDGTGAAIVVYQNNEEIHSKKIKCNKEASVFQAEMIAIQNAIKYITNQQNKNQRYKIVTDSKSSLETLRNRKRNTRLIEETVQELKKVYNKITWYWTRAHTGKQGNERADQLAREATKEADTITIAEIPIQTIKQKIRKQTIEKERTWYENTVNGKQVKKLMTTYNQAIKLSKGMSAKTMEIVTGHGNIKTYLKNRLKKIEDDLCDCKTETQTPEHILFRCKLENDTRDKISAKMKQPWPRNYDELRTQIEEVSIKMLNEFTNQATALKNDQTINNPQQT